MVEVGGEMRVSGQGPIGGVWRVGIDDPRVGVQDRKIGLILKLTKHSVATSGNYRNRYEMEGQTVFHTFDPRTGRPAKTNVLSATVVARDCQAADGAATALMVMSYEEGRA